LNTWVGCLRVHQRKEGSPLVRKYNSDRHPFTSRRSGASPCCVGACHCLSSMSHTVSATTNDYFTSGRSFVEGVDLNCQDVNQVNDTVLVQHRSDTMTGHVQHRRRHRRHRRANRSKVGVLTPRHRVSDRDGSKSIKTVACQSLVVTYETTLLQHVILLHLSLSSRSHRCQRVRRRRMSPLSCVPWQTLFP
jgi:hypothetical protein